MLAMLINLVMSLVLIAVVLGGVALFWIARQDDSRLGRILGLFAVAFGSIGLLYVIVGHHWL